MKKNRLRKYAFLLIFSLICHFSFAQSYFSNLSTGYGYILKIYPDFPNNTGASTTSFSLYQSNKNKPWTNLHNNPSTGFTVSYSNFGNNDVLGWGLGVQYKYQRTQPLTNRLFRYEELLTGILYNSKPYNAIYNSGNIVLGSEFTFLVSFEFGLKYVAKKDISYNAGFRYIHGSNSHTHLPNVGINIPTLLVGVSMPLKNNSTNEPVSTNFQINDSTNVWKARIQAGWGTNENGGTIDASDGPNYNIYLFSAGASKRSGKAGKMILMLQGYYNSGYRTLLSIDETIIMKNNFSNASVVLFSVGYEFLLGRFGFNIMGGINIHKPFLKYHLTKDNNSFMNNLMAWMPGKLGVNYYFYDPYKNPDKNIYLGLYVKSNVGIADFLETSVGIEF